MKKKYHIIPESYIFMICPRCGGQRRKPEYPQCKKCGGKGGLELYEVVEIKDEQIELFSNHKEQNHAEQQKND